MCEINEIYQYIKISYTKEFDCVIGDVYIIFEKRQYIQLSATLKGITYLRFKHFIIVKEQTF